MEKEHGIKKKEQDDQLVREGVLPPNEGAVTNKMRSNPPNKEENEPR